MSEGPYKELPASLAAWLESLTFGKKREYAEAYARALLSGSAPPPSPKVSGKDWPLRTRKRVERLLRDADAPTVVVSPALLTQDPGNNSEVGHDALSPIDLSDRATKVKTVYEMVPGLRSIGDVPIPFHELPPRAAARYAYEFKTWSDVGNATIQELMGRQRAGFGTVTALLDAATHAVESPTNLSVTHAGTDEFVELDITPLSAALALVGRWWGLFHGNPRALINCSCSIAVSCPVTLALRW